MISRRSIALVLSMWAMFSAAAWLAGNLFLRHHESKLLETLGAKQDIVLRSATEAIRLVLATADELDSLLQLQAELKTGDRASEEGMARAILSIVARSRRFGIVEASLTDENGTVEWSSDKARMGLPPFRYDTLLLPQDADHGMWLDRPTVDRTSGQWRVRLARAIGGGQAVHFSVVSIDTTALGRVLHEISERNVRVVIRRASDGALIAESQPTKELELGPPAVAQHLVAAARQNPDGRFDHLDAAGDQTAFCIYRLLDGTPFLIAVGIDRGVIYDHQAELSAFVHGLIIAASLLALISGVAGLVLRQERRTNRLLREATEAQVASEEDWARLNEIMASSPVVIYEGTITTSVEHEPQVQYRFMSQNAERILGFSQEDLGTPAVLEHRIDPSALAYRRHVFAHSLQDRQYACMDYRVRHPDGNWRWMREETIRRESGGSGSVSIVGSIADITGTRELEAKAVTAAKLTALGEMSAEITHELNQPLTAMMIACEASSAALAEADVPHAREQALSDLTLISRQLERCRTLLKQLRRFSMPATDIALQPTSFHEALDGALLLVRSSLSRLAIVPAIEIPTALPPIWATRSGLEQVLVNLLMNARDALLALPEGTPRTIVVMARDEGGRVVAEVRDSGCGIADTSRARIFEPFYTTKAADQGSGLGLSICEAIMRSFKGAIEVISDGHGTSFVLSFRVARPAPSQLPSTRMHST